MKIAIISLIVLCVAGTLALARDGIGSGGDKGYQRNHTSSDSRNGDSDTSTDK